ncbi:dna-Directed DNA polymerase [Arthrobacter sp. Hiyo8]|nr:dna-Directed DNA polymerase [Arthrobacter sp. Hiyo8]
MGASFCRRPRIRGGLRAGIEISCRTREGISVHLLSYLHDPAHPGLLEEITKAKDARLTRAKRMVTLLAEDYPLSWDDVIHHVAPGATVGRPTLPTPSSPPVRWRAAPKRSLPS